MVRMSGKEEVRRGSHGEVARGGGERARPPMERVRCRHVQRGHNRQDQGARRAGEGAVGRRQRNDGGGSSGPGGDRDSMQPRCTRSSSETGPARRVRIVGSEWWWSCRGVGDWGTGGRGDWVTGGGAR